MYIAIDNNINLVHHPNLNHPNPTNPSIIPSIQNYPKNLNIAHINGQSISAHFDEIKNILAFNEELHILCISETWLQSHTNKSVSIPGFKIFRADRTVTKAGGVAIYIKDNIKAKVISKSLGKAGPDYLFIEIYTMFSKVLLSGIYRPPSVSYTSLNEVFGLLTQMSPSYKDIILLGDLNCNMLKARLKVTPASVYLKEQLFLINLKLVNSKPTNYHIPTGSSTLIDLILTSELEKIIEHGQISVSGISMHELTR